MTTQKVDTVAAAIRNANAYAALHPVQGSRSRIMQKIEQELMEITLSLNVLAIVAAYDAGVECFAEVDPSIITEMERTALPKARIGLRSLRVQVEDDLRAAEAYRAEMDRQYAMVGWTDEMAQAERDQEARAFLSDPDYLRDCGHEECDMEPCSRVCPDCGGRGVGCCLNADIPLPGVGR